MSFQAMAWAVKQDTKSPVSKLVLLMIANYSNERNESYPSQTHLAKLCQCTRVSVNKHVKDLEKCGYLSIRKQKNGMFGYNLYTLNINMEKDSLVNNLYIAGKESLHNTQDKLITQFHVFWEKCPRKIGKKKVQGLYKKLVASKTVTEDTLIISMENYNLSVKDTATKYIAHPATWLTQGRWEDVLDVKDKSKNFLLG
tara:strand:- start:580 stop:1173 length:594 start_codon:yes stop_codon:yes gene_type:complete